MQQKFADLIEFFELTEKGYFFSYAFFNAMLYELEEFVEYHEMLTTLAKAVLAEVRKSQGKDDDLRGLLNFSDHFGDGLGPVRLETRTPSTAPSNSNFKTIDSISSLAPTDPLSELKTVIRIQYNKMLDLLYEAANPKLCRNTEAFLRLYEGLLVMKVNIQLRYNNQQPVYSLRFQDMEVSKPV